jgi:polyphosphate glucokinase
MKKAIGIDIGGTGIKGALVNRKKGTLASDRIRVETPDGARPQDIANQVAEIVNQLEISSVQPVGICFPAIVKNGMTLSAANVDESWIGLQADRLFSEELSRNCLLVNDADAAGVAEMRFGAGKDVKGLVIMATLGTGIGTSVFWNGKLIPNSELGHIEIDGVDYESRASFAAKERDSLSFQAWSERLTKYFNQLDRLLSPDLFIIGGGVSKQHEEFLPLIDCAVPMVPARTRNNAGIIGAAFLAAKKFSK